ncbi:MAG TPA: hypothetical protein PLJ71_18200 [Candidatus Hydrogenedentes bacterium]|nr:hypothetical protein [Candidatus Hydrogenedentota bacterium]
MKQSEIHLQSSVALLGAGAGENLSRSAQLLCLLVAAIALCPALAHAVPVHEIPLENPVKLENQRIACGKTVRLPLPPLPPQAGKVLILRFAAFSQGTAGGGCNYNLGIMLNEVAPGRTIDGEQPRLIGRESMLELSGGGHGNTVFPIFSGRGLLVTYAPDVPGANHATRDGMGAVFVLDVSDLARGADGNTLELTNLLPEGLLQQGAGTLVVEGLEIGWLDRSFVPAPSSDVPARGPIGTYIKQGGLSLGQGSAGGFAVQMDTGTELRVETALGMAAQHPSAGLRAEDGVVAPFEVSTKDEGEYGFHVSAHWPSLTLERTIMLRDGLVEWSERWTNTGAERTGVPFRHRFHLHSETGLFALSGDTEAGVVDTAASNPTVFVESEARDGTGFGVTAESDWLRRLMSLRERGGVAEVYSECLALDAGACIELKLTITPVKQGGYWTFMNDVRRRWGVNGYCVAQPFFFACKRPADAENEEEAVRRALAHLGPACVGLPPWLRLQQDSMAVGSGNWPKKPEGAEPAPGTFPELDVAKFLTFEHREQSWQAIQHEIELIHRVCPHIKVIPYCHPAMEVVYRPVLEQWPWLDCAVRTADGRVFEDGTYSRAWLGEYSQKDWGVFYFVPREGTGYFDYVLSAAVRAMDGCGADGIYCDEFSWAFRRNGYSRYDYSRWDGYSADLDEEGHVVRLKSDNAWASIPFQKALIDLAVKRSKLFLANGPDVHREFGDTRFFRFTEAGNGVSTWPGAHLNAVPLLYGNFGDFTTREGVFATVRAAVLHGLVYSPVDGTNLLLDSPDNFVSRLYPITIRELGPGWILGEQRLITVKSGSYRWPDSNERVRLYVYDAAGNLSSVSEPLPVAAGEPLRVEVPGYGLVIAEITS